LFKSFLLGSAALAAVAVAGAAYADQPNTEEVIVTANKQAEKIHDVAQAVTAISGSDMALRQETDFRDFAAQVPGFQVSESSPILEREIIRGQNSGGAGATVATMVDGMPLSFSGSDNNAALTSTNIDTYDLQRIEVLKGPQGTLYGATAEGGVVKYVTNAPDLKNYQGGMEAVGYNVAHGDSSGSVKGFANLPIIDDKLALRVTAIEEGVAGYINDPLMQREHVNQGDKRSFRAQLLFKPTNDLSIRLAASQQDIDMRGPNTVEAVGAGLYPAAAAPGNQLSLANGYNENTYAQQTQKGVISYYYADINYDLHGAQVNSVSSYGTVRASYVDDVSNTNAAPGFTYQAYLAGALKTPLALRQRELEGMDKASEELRVSSDPGQKLFGLPLDWIAGGFVTHESVTFNQVFDFTNVPSPGQAQSILSTLPTAGGESEPSHFDEWAMFGQLDYHFTPTFDVAAGARFANDREALNATFQGAVLVPNGAPAVGPINGNSTATTWSVAPRWHVTDDTLLYSRVATGYRPGGPNLAIPFQPAGYPQNYGPDQTVNYEVGAKSYLFDKKVDIDVAAYYIDWSKIQILSTVQTSTGPFTVTGNAGSATSKGLEWNVGWTVVPGLRLAEIGSYSDATLSQSAPVLGGLEGQALPYVPKWSNTVDADYEWNAFGDYTGFAGASWVYTGVRYTGFAPSGTPSEGHVELPSYNQINLQGGLRNGRYIFELFAHNLTDVRGISTYENMGGYKETGQMTLIQPRTIGLRVGATY
jgi:iron complex outermembrane receptor protein